MGLASRAEKTSSLCRRHVAMSMRIPIDEVNKDLGSDYASKHNSCNSPVVARSRDLNEKQNERISEVVRSLLQDGGGTYTQTSLGEALGVSQSTISSLKSGRHGTSMGLAVDICALAGVDATSLVGGPAVSESAAAHLANLTRAIELGRKAGYLPETLGYAATIAQHWPTDRDFGAWMAELEAFEQALRAHKSSSRTKRAKPKSQRQKRRKNV